MLARSQFQVARGNRAAILAPRKSNCHSEVRQGVDQFDPGSNLAGQINKDGSTHQMISNSTWLASGAAVLDDQGTVVRWNDELADWAGSSPSSHPSIDHVLGLRSPAWAGQIREMLKSGEPFQEALLEEPSANPSLWYRLELISHGSTRVLRLARCLPPFDDLAEFSSDALTGSEDNRREIYARMVRAEGQLKMLSGRWPGVLFSQRPDFSFSFLSEKMEEWTGISIKEWQSGPVRFWDVVHQADASELQMEISRCKSGEPVTSSFRIRHIQTGRVTYILERRQAIVSSNGLVLGYDGAWVDVTRQTIAENRLASLVWKETLGVLTMGLAHDFSNILAGIYALSETYESQPPDGPEPFALIRKSEMQPTLLVQRILSLHQGKVGNRSYHTAQELIADTVEVVRKTLRRITIRTDLASQSLPLYIDPVEFRQVLVNMALNAADAMPEGGELCIGASLNEHPAEYEFIQGSMPKGPTVCIMVHDTGSGISPDHLPNIFDPFFTTKPLNKGSGLGLYNARLFIEKHNGAITVASAENVGTTFRLWLPLSDFTEADRLLAEPGRDRRTILLVEFSGKALDATAQCLRECGFYVATADSERAAVELLHSPDYQFDAVMTVLNGSSRLSPKIFNEISRLKLPLRKIVQIAGCNADEHDTAMLDRADLVIGSEVSPLEFASRLRDVFNQRH